MIIKNAQIVLNDKIIKGFISFNNGKIDKIIEGNYKGNDESVDANDSFLMPGFIDVHIHGSLGIDFMDATSEEIHKIGNTLNKDIIVSFDARNYTSIIEDNGQGIKQ